MSSDTIFARSSGAGRAGVTVFRISGPAAGPILERMTGQRGVPRRARLCDVRLGDGTLLDQGLALWFPGPASFTGEDCAELHLHGSLAVERGLADALRALGAVPAAAGAFTLRAFENGKLDLVQAEGLADLLRAETDGQRRHALGQLGGRLSELAEGWRGQLLEAQARLAASIDFADEEDVPDEVIQPVRRALGSLVSEMDAALAQAEASLRLRDGARVVLTGPPNAGKSSLLNALAGGDHAIVSDVAGTTRDVIEVRIERQGQLIVLVDTAGLRETTDAVERIGVERAEAAASSADLRLVLRPTEAVTGPAPDDGALYLATKADAAPARSMPSGWLPVTVRTPDGLAPLLEALDARLAGAAPGPLARERHVAAVGEARRAISLAMETDISELAAAGLQTAVAHLEELTGRIGTEEVLGAVFSEFCIGK